jgi:hypothetical protein
VNSERVGQEGREVEDALDLELREHPIEQVDVGDRAGELAPHQPGERRFERADVQRDDRRARRREARDQASG